MILKVANLSNHGIRWSAEHLSFIDIDLFESSSKAHLQDNDILLLGAAHQRNYIGKRADILDFIPEEFQQCIMCVAEILYVRPDFKEINPYYLLSALRMPIIQNSITKLVRGQTGHLYPDDLGELEIPVPDDFEFQKDIARSTLASDKVVSRLLKEAESLQASVSDNLESAILFAESPVLTEKPNNVSDETFDDYKRGIIEVNVDIEDNQRNGSD